jgi:hypothetical protein
MALLDHLYTALDCGVITLRTAAAAAAAATGL